MVKNYWNQFGTNMCMPIEAGPKLSKSVYKKSECSGNRSEIMATSSAQNCAWTLREQNSLKCVQKNKSEDCGMV